jgi:hypothetical protein
MTFRNAVLEFEKRCTSQLYHYHNWIVISLGVNHIKKQVAITQEPFKAN